MRAGLYGRKEVIHWAALLRNEERKCENTSIASCWLARDISVERANNDHCDIVDHQAIKKAPLHDHNGAFFNRPVTAPVNFINMLNPLFLNTFQIFEQFRIG